MAVVMMEVADLAVVTMEAVEKERHPEGLREVGTVGVATAAPLLAGKAAVVKAAVDEEEEDRGAAEGGGGAAAATVVLATALQQQSAEQRPGLGCRRALGGIVPTARAGV